MMEKFAERYYSNNTESVFENAGALIFTYPVDMILIMTFCYSVSHTLSSVSSFISSIFSPVCVRHFFRADSVYVFAFHIIMLATDLHSPHIKRADKISKEVWLKNNTGALHCRNTQR